MMKAPQAFCSNNNHHKKRRRPQQQQQQHDDDDEVGAAARSSIELSALTTTTTASKSSSCSSSSVVATSLALDNNNNNNDDDDDTLQVAAVHTQQRKNLLHHDQRHHGHSACCFDNSSSHIGSASTATAARSWLYTSHAVAQLAEVSWQFGLSFFLAALSNYSSLILVSTYGLCQHAMVSLGLPWTGRWMDDSMNNTTTTTTTQQEALSTSRLDVVHGIIYGEAVSVVLATVCCCGLLGRAFAEEKKNKELVGQQDNDDDNDDWTLHSILLDAWSIVLLVGVHLFGSIAQVCDQTFTVAMERDWVVQMALTATTTTAAAKTTCQNHGSSSNTIKDDSSLLYQPVMAASTPQQANEEEFELDNRNDSSLFCTQHNDDTTTPAKAAPQSTATTAAASDDYDDDDSSSFSYFSLLANMNVVMRQLDLTAKVVAPAMAGWILPWLATTNNTDNDNHQHHGHDKQQQQQPAAHDLTTAAAWLGVWNVMALLLQYVATWRVYQLTPALSSPRRKRSPTQQQNGGGGGGESLLYAKLSPDDDDNDDNDEPQEEEEEMGGVIKNCLEQQKAVQQDGGGVSCCCACFSGTTATGQSCFYFQLDRQVVCGGLALALLYTNGLTFGNGILTTYLLYRGMTLRQVGIWRGLAAAIGLAGTACFRWSLRCGTTLAGTALWSIVYQFACLAVSCASLVLWMHEQDNDNNGSNNNDSNSNTASLALLIGGVCASRMGLWVFDLAVTQLQQETCPDEQRGAVGGVQQALNATFGIVCFALGLAFPRAADDFDAYLGVAAGSVGLAAALYAYGYSSSSPSSRHHQDSATRI